MFFQNRDRNGAEWIRDLEFWIEDREKEIGDWQSGEGTVGMFFQSRDREGAGWIDERRK